MEKVTLEYMTFHTPQMNGVIERRFSVIKREQLAMLLNDTAEKIAVGRSCSYVRKHKKQYGYYG